MNSCKVCGNPFTELHHIVFRSQCKHMINIDINFMYLCNEHHRGNNSPHMSRKIDLKYKKQLQDKLLKLFTNEYLSIEDIKNKLNITETNANKIVKTLRIYKSGYDKFEVVKLLMGGKIYDEGEQYQESLFNTNNER